MSEIHTEQKLKIFVSYSRKDGSEFVDELVAGLDIAGFAPFFDRHDIEAGENWEARLGALIEEADTVIFVVSPEAVKSERCDWEIKKTVSLSKRLLPVIFKGVPANDMPESLGRLQFVHFDGERGFARPLSQLAEALRRDIDWIREHTRLAELAARWQKRGSPNSLLLRGDDLFAVRAWSAARKAEAPEITASQRLLLAASEAEEAANARRQASEKKERARQRWRVRQVGALAVVLAILTLVGWRNELPIRKVASYVQERLRWFIAIRPYMATNITPYVLRPETERALKPSMSFRECAKDCPEMVVIPAGGFMMGGDGEFNQPEHAVPLIHPFALSKSKVTFSEWNACAEFGDCDAAIYNALVEGRRPMVNVSWDDAQAYVVWLSKMTGQSYRLVTEAEWEYAARAGTTTAYYWGDEIGKNNADCDGCGSQWDNKETAPVGSFAPNKFGLYDMAGNAWEWVDDCWHDDYRGAPVDGSAWEPNDCADYHVVRGGSWYSPPELLRSATRLRSFNYRRDDNGLGFRIGRTLLPPAP